MQTDSSMFEVAGCLVFGVPHVFDLLHFRAQFNEGIEVWRCKGQQQRACQPEELPAFNDFGIECEIIATGPQITRSHVTRLRGLHKLPV